MKLTIVIALDGAAFANIDGALDNEAVGGIVIRTGQALQRADDDSGVILDTNGNTVGRWDVTND